MWLEKVMFVKALCKMKGKQCKIDCSVINIMKTPTQDSLCWACWGAGTNDSKTRQLLSQVASSPVGEPDKETS